MSPGFGEDLIFPSQICKGFSQVYLQGGGGWGKKTEGEKYSQKERYKVGNLNLKILKCVSYGGIKIILFSHMRLAQGNFIMFKIKFEN